MAVAISSKPPRNPFAPEVVAKDNVKEKVVQYAFQNLETIQKSLPKEN